MLQEAASARKKCREKHETQLIVSPYLIKFNSYACSVLLFIFPVFSRVLAVFEFLACL